MSYSLDCSLCCNLKSVAFSCFCDYIELIGGVDRGQATAGTGSRRVPERLTLNCDGEPGTRGPPVMKMALVGML